MTRRKELRGRLQPLPDTIILILAHGHDWFAELPSPADDPQHVHAVERNTRILQAGWRDIEIRQQVFELLREKTGGETVRPFGWHLFGNGKPGEVTVEDVRGALADYQQEWDRFTAAWRAKWRGKSGGKGFDGNGGGGDDPDPEPSGSPLGELIEV